MSSTAWMVAEDRRRPTPPGRAGRGGRGSGSSDTSRGGPSCPPASGPATRRSSGPIRWASTPGRVGRAAGCSRRASMKTPHRSAKFTSEPTSSRISIRGGRPASMARSLRRRCANEWSVPIAALSMSSMALAARSATVGSSSRRAASRSRPDSIAKLRRRLLGERDGGDAGNLDSRLRRRGRGSAARGHASCPIRPPPSRTACWSKSEHDRGASVVVGEGRIGHGAADRSGRSRSRGSGRDLAVRRTVRSARGIGPAGGRPACAPSAGARRPFRGHRGRSSGRTRTSSTRVPRGRSRTRPPRSTPPSGSPAGARCRVASAVSVSDADERSAASSTRYQYSPRWSSPATPRPSAAARA